MVATNPLPTEDESKAQVHRSTNIIGGIVIVMLLGLGYFVVTSSSTTSTVKSELTKGRRDANCQSYFAAQVTDATADLTAAGVDLADANRQIQEANNRLIAAIVSGSEASADDPKLPAIRQELREAAQAGKDANELAKALTKTTFDRKGDLQKANDERQRLAVLAVKDPEAFIAACHSAGK